MLRPSDHDFLDPDADEAARTPLEWARIGRMAVWSGLAIMAALGAVLVARSESGSERLSALFAKAPEAAQTMAGTSPAEDRIAPLAKSIRALEAGRAEISARLDAVEERLTVTGSVSSAAPAESAFPAREAALPSSAFGLDLGGAPSLDALRDEWSIVRAQHAAVLDGLHPVAAIRDGPQPGGFEVRLVVGPLANELAAARLCAVIGATGRPCLPAPFEGQRLALR